MFDLVSTRTSTDPQTAACARLLCGVIGHAVRDACRPLRNDEIRRQQNTDPDARQAIRFLFGPRSTFNLYASLIGLNPHTLRAALLDAGHSTQPLAATAHGHFDADARRALHKRLRMADDLICTQYAAALQRTHQEPAHA